MHLLIYLDDILIMATTKEQCLEQAQLIAGLLEKLGYVINREKSVLEAGIPWVCNRDCGNEVFLAEMKILKIQNLAEQFLSEQISARQLASLLGLLQATLPAITNFSKTTSQSSGPVAGYLSSYNNCSFMFSKSPERPFQGSKFLRGKTVAGRYL